MSPSDFIERVIRPEWPLITEAQLEGIEADLVEWVRNVDRDESEKAFAEFVELCTSCDRAAFAGVYREMKARLFEIGAKPFHHPAVSKRANEALQWIALKNSRQLLHAMRLWFVVTADNDIPPPSNAAVKLNSPEHFHEIIDSYGLDQNAVIELTVEIHFHEQEKVSLYLESNCSGDHEKFGEIALFVFCALRMLSNLDVCEPSDRLARIIMAPAMMPDVGAAEMTENLQIIPYPGYPGRKRFFCKLRMSKKGCKFDLDYSGFDLKGGSDFGYYAPAAVIALMKHLAQRRITDVQFQRDLTKAAETCGALHLKRQISLTNQIPVGVAVVAVSRWRYASNLPEEFFRDAIIQAGGSYPTEVPKTGCLLVVAVGMTVATVLGFWLV